MSKKGSELDGISITFAKNELKKIIKRASNAETYVYSAEGIAIIKAEHRNLCILEELINAKASLDALIRHTKESIPKKVVDSCIEKMNDGGS